MTELVQQLTYPTLDPHPLIQAESAMKIAANGRISLMIAGIDPNQFAVTALVEPESNVAVVSRLRATPEQVRAEIGRKMLRALELGCIDHRLTAIDFICCSPAELDSRAAHFRKSALRLHGRTNGKIRPHGDYLPFQPTREYLAADNRRSVRAWVDLSKFH